MQGSRTWMFSCTATGMDTQCNRSRLMQHKPTRVYTQHDADLVRFQRRHRSAHTQLLLLPLPLLLLLLLLLLLVLLLLLLLLIHYYYYYYYYSTGQATGKSIPSASFIGVIAERQMPRGAGKGHVTHNEWHDRRC